MPLISEKMLFLQKDLNCLQKTGAQCTPVEETESCSIWQTLEPTFQVLEFQGLGLRELK